MALTDESNGIRVEKRIHHTWQLLEDASRSSPYIKQEFGKYNYLYSKGKNAISLTELVDAFHVSAPWEMYQVKGEPKLFKGVERFKSKDEAIIRIKELFNE